MSGNGIVPLAVQMGATGGAMKAGIMGFVGLLQFTPANIALVLLVAAFGSCFGIAILVTPAISNIVLDKSMPYNAVEGSS